MRNPLVQMSPSLSARVWSSTRRLTAIATLLAVSGYIVLKIAQADTTPRTLPFSQNWSDIGLITTDNDWSGVPGVIGYRGDDLTTATGTNPQTIVADGSGTPVSAEANETNPNVFATGGVAEFHITDPVIALNGSGTADAPHIVITLNTTGQTNVNVAYNLRDLDGSGDNAIMPVALQFRVGMTGIYTDVPAGFVADATTGPNLSTLVTPVSATLPAAANNQPVVQVRVITTNAVGNDEWVGVDDISVTSTPIDPTPLLSVNDVSVTEGDSGGVSVNFTVSLSTPAPMGGVTFNIATQDNTATTADNDYVGKSATGQSIPEGQQSYTFSVMVNGDTNVESNESFFVNVTDVTGANVADAQGAGAIVTDDFAITLIHDIQGNAETPNFVGQVKAIRGVVVGDFQGAANLNGFFVQEEDADADADPATSEGVFIFDPAALTPVDVGDNVTVTGAVTNFGSPLGLTELISVVSVVVNSSGNPLPAASVVSLPAPSSPAADLERFEGMRVMFNQTLFVTGNDDLGRFGELVLSAGSPLFIPTNSIDPNDNPANGTSISGAGNVAAVTSRQTINNNSRIILDDARSGSNPNPIPFIGIGTDATIRRGDSVSNLSGVLSFGFGAYRIEPTNLPLSFTSSNPRTPSPASVGGALRVASFNVTNYFVDPPDPTGRGAGDAAEFARQRDKVVAALAGLNADVIGLIELEKGTQATADAAAGSLVAALNALGTVGTYAVISTPAAVYDSVNPVGTDTEIKSGIIYRTSTVTPIGSSLTDTAAAVGTYSRAPIAQTFQRNSSADKFSVVVNHFRSKSCPGSGADADQGDGQACFNDRRRSQAQAVLAFVNNTLMPIDPDALVVGDLNAYGQEDPIDVFRAAGYSDVISRFASETSQYSFTFNSEAGRLDHAFATGGLSQQITGATIWHINADEPVVFDYNINNKTDDRYAPSPFRSSDHDPVLIGLNLFTPITISGQKFNDSNGNGMKEAGEPGIQGVTINLDLGADGTVDATTPTDANGNYSFTNLGPGIYRVREVTPADSVQTTANPADIVAQSGVNVSGVDFGNLTIPALALTSVIISDPVVCLGSGSSVTVRSTIANNSASAQPLTFTSTLDPTLKALPGTCSSNIGSCSVSGPSTVIWTGTLNAGQTVTIDNRAQAADGLATGTQLCVNSVATVGAIIAGGVVACASVNCQPANPGESPPATSPVSDQRAGSVLIFNIYTSSATSPEMEDTRISVTNTEPSRSAIVHLFFVDGASCTAADSYICLTPNQTASFLASDLDPGTTGYIVAVAVDGKGCPVDFNFLIGDEYVKFESGHAANLGAEAITAIAGGLPVCDENSSSVSLSFDGVSYSALPRALALDNILSRRDGNDTLLILNRIGGDLSASADRLGALFGVFYDDLETGASFTFNPGMCQFRSSVTNGFPRISPRFESFVPAGRSGWLRLFSTSDQAILGVSINFHPKASSIDGAFNQGHNLHKLTLTYNASYTIPIFLPNC